MATTTPNYGWTVPTSTDLVKDGATAIETLGDAVDATVFANANAAIAKTIVDAKGDIIAATAADTVARLPVGTDGQALKANSATATGLEWGSVSATKNYSLLGTGTLTSGSTVTVSGISNIDEILVVIAAASNTAGNTQVNLRINGDTASNYRQAYLSFTSPAAYAATYMGNTYLSATTQISLGNINSAATDTLSGYLRLSGGATAGIKTYQMASGGNAALGNNAYNYIGGGVWNNTSTITSISLVSSGTFDAGSFFVYGSA